MEILKMEKTTKETKDFRLFFEENIEPITQKIENYRVGYLLGYFIWYTIAIVLGAMIFWKTYKIEPIGGIFLALLIFMIIHPIACMIAIRYKSTAKSYFMEKMLKSLYGLNYHNPNPSISSNLMAAFGQNIPEKHLNEDLINELSLFKYYDRISFDDYIEGKYKGMQVEIQELSLMTHICSRGSNDALSFHGIVFVCEIKKPFKGKTLVFENNFNALDDFLSKNKNAQEVHFEDTDFEKKFKVYSTDQVEARYLFTPSFIERFKKVQKNCPNYTISAEFLNGKLFFVLGAGKNWFELPFFHSAKNIETYKYISNDLSEIFAIADVLKLEDDIGL